MDSFRAVKIYLVFWAFTVPMAVLLVILGFVVSGAAFFTRQLADPETGGGYSAVMLAILGISLILWGSSSLLLGWGWHELIVERTLPARRVWQIIGVFSVVNVLLSGGFVILDFALTGRYGVHFKFQFLPLAYHTVVAVGGLILWVTSGTILHRLRCKESR